jgi:phage-related protein
MVFMKPLHWLHGEVKTPPMSADARKELGFLLRLLQEGEPLEMPQSRPMPGIGSGCHELRVTDAGGEWRLVYALTDGAVVVLDVFNKKTRATPQTVIMQCARRLREYHRRDAK